MENKTKPSKLYLVPSHHGLNNPDKSLYTLFEEEMLKWPIYLHDNDDPHLYEGGKITHIYRQVLDALCNIGPFDAVISLGVNKEKERIFFIKRTWGKILLNDEPVDVFSHDSRYANAAFRSLLEWPELPKKQDENAIEILFTWTIEDWISFFRQRIKNRALFLKKKAETQRTEAKELEESAWKFLEHLTI